MATSNSTDFTLNRDSLIRQALLNLRVVDPALTIGAQDIADAALAANLMLKAWQTDGVMLWLNEEVCMFLTSGQQSYALGPGGDHCALLTDAFKTQLAANASTGDTIITVDDDDAIDDGDFIGIQLNDGTLHWRAVDGVPAGNVVTLDDALPSGASTDNWVFSYTTRISRPLQILEARVRDTSDIDTPLYLTSSLTDFFSQTDKTSTGTALDAFYQPTRGNGKLYVWPVAGDVTDRIIMTVQRTIEDLDAAANEFDGPVEALAAVIWNLSAWLAPQYGIDLHMGKGVSIAQNAAVFYSKLKAFYTDREPVFISPR
jgi:hypothetical protein